MAIRISSALVVALALVAACGQKAAQQEPVVSKSSETRKLDPPHLASIADDEVQYAILDYVHARMDGRYDHEAIVAKIRADPASFSMQ